MLVVLLKGLLHAALHFIPWALKYLYRHGYHLELVRAVVKNYGRKKPKRDDAVAMYEQWRWFETHRVAGGRPGVMVGGQFIPAPGYESPAEPPLLPKA